MNRLPSPLWSPASLGLLLACLGCSGAPGSGASPGGDGVAVSPSSSLREGQEGTSLSISRSAGGLSGASGFDLGDLVVQRLSDSTDTRLVLTVSVPHGAALGPRTLTFTDARGTVTIPAIVTVGAITSAPTGLDTNRGTPDSPFRTIKRAVQAAGKGDTIHLLDGRYDQDGGETWGYALPDRLTVVGQSIAMTEIGGPAAAGGDASGINGFDAGADLVVRTLSLDGFDQGVNLARPGTLTLDNVRMRGHQSATIHVDAAASPATLAVTGAGTELASPTAAGISVDAAGSSVTLQGGVLSVDHDGLVLGPHCVGCTIDVGGTTISASATDGHAIEISAGATGSKTSLHEVVVNGDILISDAAATLTISSSAINQMVPTTALNFGGAALDMTDSAITVKASTFGINFQSGVMTLSSVTITGGSYCVYQLAGSAKLRGTKITDYSYIGYYLAKGDLDLGTQTEAGNNEFSGQVTGPAVFGLYVDEITSTPTCSNSTFNGVLPPAGTITAGPSPFAEPGEFFINMGKTMSFWTL